MRLSTSKVVAVSLTTCVVTLILTLLPMGGILRSYLYAATVVAAIGINIVLLGWGKVRQPYKLIWAFMILSAAVFQFAIFLLCGLKIGFVQNVYRWDFTNFFGIFLPVALLIMAEEVLRGQLVTKAHNSLPAVFCAGASIFVMNILTSLPAFVLSEGGAIFTLLAAVAGPSLVSNIMLTYIAYRFDYRVNLAYRLIMELPTYLLPILPDSGAFLPKLFEVGFVCLLLIGLTNMVQSNERPTRSRAFRNIRAAVPRMRRRVETASRSKAKHFVRYLGVGAAVCVVVAYAMLISGLFRYRLLAVGSGSMEPSLYRGDMVLMEKSDNYDQIQVGDIIVYQHGGAIMLHRVTEVTELHGQYTFRTKGDNNASDDVWTVSQNDIMGITRGRLAKFGYPVIWLNEIFYKQ